MSTVGRVDFLEAVAYLDSHAWRGVGPGLERMEFLCRLLDEPQRTAPAIHITGTNGKGSTARMITAVLAEGGLSTGTYTSPHLQSVVERIALDTRPLSPLDFADQMSELVPYFDHMESVRGEGPTYFEICTVMAFAAFAGRGIDVAVVEVGLGGRWDATNMVDGVVAVITNVDVDHVRYLGSDRRGIAREKAGIIKSGAVAVVGERDPGVLEVIEARCADVGVADLWKAGEDFDVVDATVAFGGQVVSIGTRSGVYRDLFLPLHGRHQAHNAAAAVASLEAFHGEALSEELVRQSLSTVRTPGRLEVVGRHPLVVLDVAHNPHGAAALGAALVEAFSFREKVVVLGILGDKDRGAMLPHIVPGAHVVATAAQGPHSVPPDLLAKEADEAGALSVHVVPGVASAVERARDMAGSEDLVLVTGSHYSVGEARAHLVGPGPAV